MELNKGKQTCFIFININNFYNHMKKNMGNCYENDTKRL